MHLETPAEEPPIPVELLFQRLMESLPAHVFFKDIRGRFICINQSLALKFGLAHPQDAVGLSDYDFFPEELARQKDADEREIVRTGTGIIDMVEADWTDPHNRQWASTTKLALRGDDGTIIGTFGISRDITETKLAHEELETQHRLLRTLIEILPCRIFVKDRTGRLQLTNEAYRRALIISPDDKIIGRTLSEIVPHERGALASADDQEVLERGASIINREQPDTTADVADRWILLSKVPLHDHNGDISGLVGMAADITPQKEAQALVNRARLELEKKNQQMEAELAVARDLQRELMQSGLRNANDLLEHHPDGHARLTLYYEASERLAGDFVHAIALSPTRVGILICDVMGHGVRASLVTALIRGLVGDARLRELSPGEVLDRLNSRLCKLLDQPVMPRFVTALFAAVDLQAGTLSMANAGHPWPLVQSADGGVRTSKPGACDPALGLLANVAYTTFEQTISPGDRLLLLTDGWVEEPDAAGEEFGLERLTAHLTTAPADPADALRHLVAAIQAHSGTTDCQDDLCAVLLQT